MEERRIHSQGGSDDDGLWACVNEGSHGSTEDCEIDEALSSCIQVSDGSMAIDCGGSRCKIVCFHREVLRAPLPHYVTEDKGPQLPIREACSSNPTALSYLTLPTKKLPDFLDWCQAKGLLTHFCDKSSEISATGGGAFKYYEEIKQKLGVSLRAKSEMGTLVRGLNFLLSNSPSEVFEYGLSTKTPLLPAEDTSLVYPYLLTSIGSGVSILKVTGPNQWERVSGSCVGGGTFWGLSKLITNVKSWEQLEHIRQEEPHHKFGGDNTKVDLLVGDIYGGRGMKNLGLRPDVIASSFGKCGVHEPDDQHLDSDIDSVGSLRLLKRKQKKFRKKKTTAIEAAGVAEEAADGDFRPQDICRSLLLMVANNIGQITYLNAKLHGIERVYFTGGFTHDNPYVWSKLSYAINFWSNGSMRARFIQHDGYIGAVGALLTEETDS